MAPEQHLYVVQPQKRDAGKVVKPSHKASHPTKSRPEAAAPVSPARKPTPSIPASAVQGPADAAVHLPPAAGPAPAAGESAAGPASQTRFSPEQASPPTQTTQPVPPAAASSHVERSYFDGKLLQLVGWRLLGALITLFTLGICYPWAVCMIYGWEAKHTVINGNRLRFDGTALQLFGTWIKWWLLTLITLGIYSFWLPIKTKQWITKHTVFAD